MEIFDGFRMNGIENYPAACDFFLENVILKVSQTDFPRISTPRRGQCPPLALPRGGHKFFTGLLTSLAEGIARRAMPSLFFFLVLRGACQRPDICSVILFSS